MARATKTNLYGDEDHLNKVVESVNKRTSVYGNVPIKNTVDSVVVGVADTAGSVLSGAFNVLKSIVTGNWKLIIIGAVALFVLMKRL